MMLTDSYLIDTNVISEVMRQVPNASVMHWLNAQEEKRLFLSATSLAELLSGLGNMPVGRRKTDLEQLLRTLRNEWFSERILPFTEEAAERYGLIVSEARRRGLAISWTDGQIAAIAAAHGFAVATRDVAPFKAADVAVINPWERA